MVDDKGMLELDLGDLSGPEKLILLIVDEGRTVSDTRLQTVALLYYKTYRPSECGDGCAFDGYFDRVAESAVNLADKCILRDDWGQYSLTGYGRMLRRMLVRSYGDDGTVHDVGNLVEAVSDLSDKQIIALSHHFYRDIAVNSTIRESVVSFNGSFVLDGTPLGEYGLQRFQDSLHSGCRMRGG